jgi:thiamine kinase-like enzyme
LEGGITNRNYRATFGETDYVVRLPGRDTDLLGIDRGAEGAAARVAAEAGIAPPVAALLEDPPCLVTEFVEGRQVDEEDLRGPALLEDLARALRRMHESREILPVAFDSFRIVERYEATARERGAPIPADYADAARWAECIEGALQGAEHRPVPCHNDLLAGNLLVDGRVIHIVDWEYAGMGDRFFDLGNLAVNNGLGPGEEERLLSAYFGEPPDERRKAALALMRFMSDFREAMWGVVQGTVSDLDVDFDEYAATHFARLRRTAEDERFRGWLRQAAG